jgi:hypothetical protein
LPQLAAIAYETVGEARSSIGQYLDFYNGPRSHSSLDDAPKDQAYFDLPPSARRPNPGRGSTYRRGKSVQTTGTSSIRPKPGRVIAEGLISRPEPVLKCIKKANRSKLAYRRLFMKTKSA